jgi:hypothetical protein
VAREPAVTVRLTGWAVMVAGLTTVTAAAVSPSARGEKFMRGMINPSQTKT